MVEAHSLYSVLTSKPGAAVRTAAISGKTFASAAAIVLWNTVYLDRTVTTLTQDGKGADPELLRFLSPLGWEHINLTGNYTRPRTNKINPGKYRPLGRSVKTYRRIFHFLTSHPYLLLILPRRGALLIMP